MKHKSMLGDSNMTQIPEKKCHFYLECGDHRVHLYKACLVSGLHDIGHPLGSSFLGASEPCIFHARPWIMVFLARHLKQLGLSEHMLRIKSLLHLCFRSLQLYFVLIYFVLTMGFYLLLEIQVCAAVCNGLGRTFFIFRSRNCHFHV